MNQQPSPLENMAATYPAIGDTSDTKSRAEQTASPVSVLENSDSTPRVDSHLSARCVVIG